MYMCVYYVKVSSSSPHVANTNFVSFSVSVSVSVSASVSMSVSMPVPVGMVRLK